MLGPPNMNALRAKPMAPVELPMLIDRNGSRVEVLFHELTDEDLAWLQTQATPVEGWVWARAFARKLAGR